MILINKHDSSWGIFGIVVQAIQVGQPTFEEPPTTSMFSKDKVFKNMITLNLL